MADYSIPGLDPVTREWAPGAWEAAFGISPAEAYPDIYYEGSGLDPDLPPAQVLTAPQISAINAMDVAGVAITPAVAAEIIPPVEVLPPAVMPELSVTPLIGGGEMSLYGDEPMYLDGQLVTDGAPTPGAVQTMSPVITGALTLVIPLILRLVASGNFNGAIAAAKSALGKSWLKWLLAAAAAGLISYAIVKMLQRKRRRARRYSIGTNPRLGTLIKVSRRVNTVTTRFVNTARHAGVLRVAGRTSYRRLPARRRR